jgi:hypothetical protein
MDRRLQTGDDAERGEVLPQHVLCPSQNHEVQYRRDFKLTRVYFAGCAYKKGLRAIYGKQILDTTGYRMSNK